MHVLIVQGSITQRDPERMAASAQGPRLAELFTPKLVTVLREGYGLGALRADATLARASASAARNGRWSMVKSNCPCRT